MNKYNPNIHHRKPIRLRGYDYSQAGFYFVTIVTQNRIDLFGEIKNGKMILNDAGRMIENEWLKLPKQFPNIKLHEFITMPDHFHTILEIAGATALVGATLVVARNDNITRNDNIIRNDNGDLTNNNLIYGQSYGRSYGQSYGRPYGRPYGRRPQGQPQGIAPTNTTDTTNKTVGDMVGAYKSITTNEYIRGVKNYNWQLFDGKLWQRNYWEHIIRNEMEYNRISQYIIDNPAKWENDKLNGGNGNIVMELPAEYNYEIWMI